MSGPAGNWHASWERHLRVCREDAWAQLPAEPQWQSVPIAAGGWHLKAANHRFRPAALYDGYRPTVQLSRLQEVAGRFATSLWPELAELLLDMALKRPGGELDSYCMDFFTPADPRRYAGVMAERLEITAGAERADLSVRLRLRAGAEAPHPTLAPEDFDYAGLSPAPFTFDGAQIWLDSEPLSDVEAFKLSVHNALSVGPSRLGSIAYLAAGPRAIELDLTKLDDSDAVNAAIREGTTLGFQMSLAHPAGHSLTLSLPVLHAESAREDAGPEGLARTTVRLTAATDGAGDDVTYAVSLTT